MEAAVAFTARAFGKYGTTVETGLLVMDRVGTASWDGLPHQPQDLEATSRILAGLVPWGTARPRRRVAMDAAAVLAPRDRGSALPTGRLGFLAGATPLACEGTPCEGEGRDVRLCQAHAWRGSSCEILGRIPRPWSNPARWRPSHHRLQPTGQFCRLSCAVRGGSRTRRPRRPSTRARPIAVTCRGGSALAGRAMR